MCVCLIFDSRSGKIKTKITGSKWFERKEDIKQMRLPQIINSLLETDMYKFIVLGMPGFRKLLYSGTLYDLVRKAGGIGKQCPYPVYSFDQ